MKLGAHSLWGINMVPVWGRKGGVECRPKKNEGSRRVETVSLSSSPKLCTFGRII